MFLQLISLDGCSRFESGKQSIRDNVVSDVELTIMADLVGKVRQSLSHVYLPSNLIM
jgi:hypothetical protein